MLALAPVGTSAAGNPTRVVKYPPGPPPVSTRVPGKPMPADIGAEIRATVKLKQPVGPPVHNAKPIAPGQFPDVGRAAAYELGPNHKP